MIRNRKRFTRVIQSRAMARDRYQRGRVEESGVSVRKWRGHYYVYARDANGAEVRKHCSCVLGLRSEMTRAQAHAKLQAIIDRTANQPARADGSTTLRAFWEERYLPLRRAKWKPSTVANTISFIQSRIIAKYGDRKLDSLTRFELQEHINSVAASGASHSVVTKIRVYLHALLDEALEQGYIDRDPARKLEIPRCRKIERPVITPEQFRAITAHMSERDALILRCLVVLGLRSGELFALRVDDLGVDSVRVDESASPVGVLEPKTEASAAMVACPPSLMREIRAWVGRAKDRDNLARFVFPSEVGTPIATKNFLRRNLASAVDAARKAGADLPPHIDLRMMRRNCATWMQERGNAKDAQAHMRHATPAMTIGVYTQAVPASLMDAAAMLDKKSRAPRKKC